MVCQAYWHYPYLDCYAAAYRVQTTHKKALEGAGDFEKGYSEKLKQNFAAWRSCSEPLAAGESGVDDVQYLGVCLAACNGGQISCNTSLAVAAALL
ncbi:MAG: hypothetical protein U1E47_05275 [Rivihabitans pingtungensis]